MTYYSWLTEGSAFAKKPLLGKMSRDYVLEALKGVEILEKPEQLSGRKADLVIVIREDLPCITLEDCNELMSRAKKQPQIFRDEETDEILAMSMNGELAAQLVGGDAGLPNLPELKNGWRRPAFLRPNGPRRRKKKTALFPFSCFPSIRPADFRPLITS